MSDILEQIRVECAAIHERYYQLKMRLGGDPHKFQELMDKENEECNAVWDRYLPNFR